MANEFLNAMVEKAKQRELEKNSVDSDRYGELGNKLVNISNTWENKQRQRINDVKYACSEPVKKNERMMDIQKRQRQSDRKRQNDIETSNARLIISAGENIVAEKNNKSRERLLNGHLY